MQKKGCLKFICRTFKTAPFHVFVEYISGVVDDTDVHALIKKPLKKCNERQYGCRSRSVDVEHIERETPEKARKLSQWFSYCIEFTCKI